MVALPFRKSFNPTGVMAPRGVFAGVVTVDNPRRLVFISGQTACDAVGQVVGKGDVKAQTRKALSNVKTCVEAAGGAMRDVTQVTVYMTDLSLSKEIDQVRAEFWPDPLLLPASTTVAVPRLSAPDLLIEISAIAAT